MNKKGIVVLLLSAICFSASVASAADYKDHLKKGRELIDNCRHKEKEALVEMNLAFAVKPEDFDVIYWTGRANYETRNYGKAKDLLEKAVKIKPDNIEAQAYLAYSYGRIGENMMKRALFMLKSVQQIKKIIVMDPNFADAYFSMAIGCTYLGWYDKPTGVFRKMVQMLFQDEKLVDQFSAEMLFKKAISLDSTDPWYFVQLGWLYLRTNRGDDAAKAFDKAMALAKGDVKCGMKNDTVPRGIAIYYEDSKQFAAGLKYAKIALEWNPKDLAFDPRYNIKKVIERLEKEVKTGKPLMDNVADEL